MVTVDQFVVVLTHAVVTFSELEVAVEALKPGTASMINGRLRWMAKENIISRLLQRLQASKASLSLLLSTLTWLASLLIRWKSAGGSHDLLYQ